MSMNHLCSTCEGGCGAATPGLDYMHGALNSCHSNISYLSKEKEGSDLLPEEKHCMLLMLVLGVFVSTSCRIMTTAGETAAAGGWHMVEEAPRPRWGCVLVNKEIPHIAAELVA